MITDITDYCFVPPSAAELELNTSANIAVEYSAVCGQLGVTEQVGLVKAELIAELLSLYPQVEANFDQFESCFAA